MREYLGIHFNIVLILLLIMALIQAILFSVNAYADTGELSLEIIGLKNNYGKVLVNLYQDEDGFPTEPNKALRQLHVVPMDYKASLIIGNLNVKLEYAIAVCHDANNNNKCDTNFIGIPLEGVAVSNNAKSFLGPPSFDDAKFLIEKNRHMTISVNY